MSRRNGVWQTTSRLVGLQPTSLAIDPFQPERVYCGTFGKGLWRSLDAGHTWYPIGDAGTHIDFWQGDGIAHPRITAVAVSPLEQSGGCGVVYVGTEPSALFRSDDGGENWHELKGFHELPSAPTWFFPSRPYTHHIRWITPDLHVAGRLYVSVEIGGIMRSLDGGEHWEDRNPTGPFDTHKLLMHPLAPNRLYAATAGEKGKDMAPDFGLLFLRLVFGGLMFLHGLQKTFTWNWVGGRGFNGTRQMMKAMRLQPAEFWAWMGVVTELGGGLLFTLGFLEPLGALGLIAAMLTAILLVTGRKPFWMPQGGIEVNLVFLAPAIVEVFTGPGRYALDAFFGINFPEPATFLVGLILVLIGVGVMLLTRASVSSADVQQHSTSTIQSTSPQK